MILEAVSLQWRPLVIDLPLTEWCTCSLRKEDRRARGGDMILILAQHNEKQVTICNQPNMVLSCQCILAIQSDHIPVNCVELSCISPYAGA